MKTTIILLFLTLCIGNAVLNDIPEDYQSFEVGLEMPEHIPVEDTQSFKIGLESFSKGYKEFKQDIEEGKPLNGHFLVLHKYLEKIQADNDPNKGIVLKRFNAVITVINEVLTEIKTRPHILIKTQELEHVIAGFTTISVKHIYLLKHALEWLDLRQDLVTDRTLREQFIYVSSELNRASSKLQIITNIMEDKLEHINSMIKLSEEYPDQIGAKKINKSLTTTLNQFKSKMANGMPFDIKQYFEKFNPAVDRIAKLAGVSNSEEETVEEAVETTE